MVIIKTSINKGKLQLLDNSEEMDHGIEKIHYHIIVRQFEIRTRIKQKTRLLVKVD